MRRKLELRLVLKNLVMDAKKSVNYSGKRLQIKVFTLLNSNSAGASSSSSSSSPSSSSTSGDQTSMDSALNSGTASSVQRAMSEVDGASSSSSSSSENWQFGGKTEIKQIRSQKAKVNLSFANRIDIEKPERVDKLRFVFYCQDEIVGATQVELEKIDEALSSKSGKIAKRFRYQKKTLSDKVHPFLVLFPERVALSGPPKIDRSEITMERRLAAGAFGEVWVGSCRGSHVAIKKLKPQLVGGDESTATAALGEFLAEMYLMSENPNPNLVLFMGVCHDEEQGELYCVSELMKGDLGSLLVDESSRVNTPLSERIRMALDAAKGVAWLHTRDPPVLHRDLKVCPERRKRGMMKASKSDKKTKTNLAI
jgi:Protein tyrosine and serine/threonine kinase